MLSIKDNFAFYQTQLCLHSNVNMITIKYHLIQCQLYHYHNLQDISIEFHKFVNTIRTAGNKKGHERPTMSRKLS